MSEPITIQRIIERLMDGTVRIPGFQRKFVWDPNRAALLMDSLYKQFPVGSVLLWRTRHRLKTERNLGVFELPPPDKDYPVDYVLDGQQRLTTIFSTFQTSLPAESVDAELWLPIYYDFEAQSDAQESRFVALDEDDFDLSRHFPLSTFFDAIEFSNATRSLSETRHQEIVLVQQRFLTTLIPVETFETEDRTSVAIVFERVNHQGIALDTYQLLTAWTWSDEFDLQQQFQDLSEEFSDFGFEEVGDESDLMLRCCAAILTKDPAPSSLVGMSGAKVREAFPLVANAIRRAIDFVKMNFHVHHIKFLPYASLLVPLAAFFSIDQSAPVTDQQRNELSVWFWRSCMSHRYSGNPQRNIRDDVEEAIKLRQTGTSDLTSMGLVLSAQWFISQAFSFRTVATKTLILLLASQHPRSFLSGELITLSRVLAEPNRSEYHHCFPRALLSREGVPEKEINALANFAIISRSENRVISDRRPSVYRGLMPGDITKIANSALLPESLFSDNYPQFLGERAEKLFHLASEFCGFPPVDEVE